MKKSAIITLGAFLLVEMFSAMVSASLIAPNGDVINMVDLSLPSGTLWADRNVGADAPESFGKHYAWGETIVKSDYSVFTYLDGQMSSIGDFGTDKDLLKSYSDIAGTQFDVATVRWGGAYSIPTKAQWEELLANCTWEWGAESGQLGYIVSSPINHNWIFLPAAGFSYGSEIDIVNPLGEYGSSTLDEVSPSKAWNVVFDDTEHGVEVFARYWGQTVRPVSKSSSSAVMDIARVGVSVSQNGGFVQVSGLASGALVTFTTISGVVVSTFNAVQDGTAIVPIGGLSSGVYILSAGDYSAKILVP